MQSEWMPLTALVLVMCSNLTSVMAGLQKTCSPFNNRPASGGICGKRIDETLSILCMGNYNSYTRQRRDTGIETTDPLRKLKDMLLNRKQAHSFVKRSEYHTTGVVCECCYNRCSIGELFDYCAYSAPSYFGIFKRSLPDRLPDRLTISP